MTQAYEQAFTGVIVPKRGGHLFLLLLRLLLLLGDLLGRLWRLIDQGRSVVIFLALSDKGEPSAGHIEKGTFALGIAGLLSKSNTLRRVCSIFPGVCHAPKSQPVKRRNRAEAFLFPHCKRDQCKIQKGTADMERASTPPT
jgi:hypothetical protein